MDFDLILSLKINAKLKFGQVLTEYENQEKQK